MIQIEGQKLSTNRLLLRPFSKSDDAFLFELYRNPNVMAHLSGGTRTQEETTQSLQKHLDQWTQHGFGMWVALEKPNKIPIGYGGLRYLENAQEIELGYIINETYWGKGYASEMAAASLWYGFEKLETPSIVSVIHPENLASIRVVEKQGMHFKQKCFVYEGWNHLFEITRNQYKEGHQNS